jgi:uncharacterized membrane protein YeaQ/YmgE (transglycosylase-associated protein family)
MGIVSWLVLGAIVGLLTNRVVPERFPGGVPGAIVGGLVGAFIGGAIFTLIAGRGVAGVDFVGLGIAVIGAAVVLGLARKAAYPRGGQADP